MQQKRVLLQGVEILACPFCSNPLSLVGAVLQCERGHSFDIAQEGYVNLLPRQRPGDTKEMVRARRAFLEAGYYQPLSDGINTLVQRHISAIPGRAGVLHVLDAGCGEGYYVGRLQHALANDAHIGCVGIDISKEAVRLAAKRYVEALFVVADLTRRFVLVDRCVHLALNIFAPRNPAEFARVLVPGGILLVVIPNPEHLLSLRVLLGLLTIQEQKQQHVTAQLADAFELIESSPINYPLHLEQHAIEQVVMMTPNYWHQTNAMREAMQRLASIETEAAFNLLLFRRV